MPGDDLPPLWGDGVHDDIAALQAPLTAAQPERCKAILSLILPDYDYPSVQERCEKRADHRDYHGTLGGYCWETSNSDR